MWSDPQEHAGVVVVYILLDRSVASLSKAELFLNRYQTADMPCVESEIAKLLGHSPHSLEQGLVTIVCASLCWLEHLS